MHGRAQWAECRLGLDPGAGGFQDGLPRTESGGQRAAREAAQRFTQHAGGHGLAYGQPQHQNQHRHGQRLERFLAPQGQQRSETAADQHRGQRDGHGAGDLSVGHAAQQGRQHEQRQRGRQHHQYAQQAGQQLAQHQFAIREPGEQQQDQRAAVFLVGDFRGSQQGREERGQRQLQGGENLKQRRAEPGQVAHVADQLRARQHQPRRAHQHQQGQGVRRPRNVGFQPPRGNRHLTGKHRAYQQRDAPQEGESGNVCLLSYTVVVPDGRSRDVIPNTVAVFPVG